MVRVERRERMEAKGTYGAHMKKKMKRQRRRRLTRPAVNGALKTVLGKRDYLTVYNDLLEQQGGVCGICGKKPGKRRMDIDHDHETLEIRGLLCWSCNYKLGFVEKYDEEIRRYLHGGHRRA